MSGKVKWFALVGLTAMCCGTLCLAACTQGSSDDGTRYTVEYAAGAEDASGEAPNPTQYAAGETVTLASADTFTRSGFRFDAWSYGGASYAAGAAFKMPAEDVVFTALWQEEGLPQGTQTVPSVPAGALITENGGAAANWFAVYAQEGLRITAWVTDPDRYVGGPIGKNDGITVNVAPVSRVNGYAEHTVSVTLDAAGECRVLDAYSGQELENSGVTAAAVPFTKDGVTLSGYSAEIVVPYALAGIDSGTRNASVALSLTNASSANDARTVTDASFGTDPARVHTYIALTADNLFAENPYLYIGAWGAGGPALPAADTWDLSHDDGTENAYIRMERSWENNFIYLLASNQQNVYAEVQLHAEPNTYYDDAYPKFGLTLSKADGSRLLFYYVDAEASDSQRVDADSTALGYAYRVNGNWRWPGTSLGDLGGTSAAYTGTNSYITLGLYRQGDQALFMVDGKPIGKSIVLDGMGDGDEAYIGLASFNLCLTVKGYYATTDEEVLNKYRLDDPVSSDEKPLKQIDGDLSDWSAAEKVNPVEVPALDGRSVTIYASKDANGVNVFYDVWHAAYVTNGTEWHENTNVEFSLGRGETRFYASADGQTGGLRSENVAFRTQAPAQSGALYHTTVELFVPYSAIAGYSAQSAYVPGGFAWKTPNETGFAWDWLDNESPDFWLVPEADPSNRTIYITDRGIMTGTEKVIDGVADESWSTVSETLLVSQADVRATAKGYMGSDGLYLLVTLEAENIDVDRDFGLADQWWTNTNLEFFDTADIHSGRAMIFGGKLYATGYLTDAAYTIVRGARDVLTFEVFIARDSLKRTGETVVLDFGAQLYRPGGGSWNELAHGSAPQYIVSA